MRDFGYSRRGKDVEEARARVNLAARALVDRWNKDEPRTRRWHEEIAAYRATLDRVYSEPLRRIDRGEVRASATETAPMLDFLEADPVFFGSGYMKERLLRELKRRSLETPDAERLRAIILAVVAQPDRRREFRAYCRAAPNVTNEAFRAKLAALEGSPDVRIRQRANWVLAAIAGRWLDLKQAARGYQRIDDRYVSVAQPLVER